MSQRLLISAIILLLFAAASAFGQNDEGGGGGSGGGSHSGVHRKVEKKLKTRWSLAEWMEQKKNMKLMDQWLAINTSDNPYEFFLEGERNETDRTVSNSGGTTTEKWFPVKGRMGAYATILGIEGGYDTPQSHWEAWDATLNLRILGTAQQNTNLTLLGGVKSYSFDDEAQGRVERYQNTVAGAQMTLYLTRYVGLEGYYHRLFFDKSNFSTSLSGENSKAILFIDFSFVRLYGGVSRERLVFNENETNKSTDLRDSFLLGLRLWF